MSSHQMTEQQVLDAILAEADRQRVLRVRRPPRTGRDRRDLRQGSEDRGGRSAAVRAVCRAAQAGPAGLGEGLRGQRFQQSGDAGLVAWSSCWPGSMPPSASRARKRTGGSSMKSRSPLGGVIHTYQKYDPQHFPSPRQPPPDVVSGAFEHLLAYGDLRELSDEELARAVRIDPRQIAGLGPSLEALMAMLRERKRKILANLRDRARGAGGGPAIPAVGRRRSSLRRRWPTRFHKAVQQEQLYDLERLWYLRRRTWPLRPAVAAADRQTGREVSDRRAGGQVRLHRPHAHDHSPGAGNQGGIGGDRPAAETVGRGGQDGADRRDRHGGTRPSTPTRATSSNSTAWPGRSRSISATWPSSRDWHEPPADTSLRPRRTGCFRGGCWTGSSATCRRRGRAGTRRR